MLFVGESEILFSTLPAIRPSIATPMFPADVNVRLSVGEFLHISHSLYELEMAVY